ncbi:hypothetical protein BST47_14290 [Mycolicibacterium tusciae]|uniref:Methyltransferase domain-containing protein n=5 Tax=Mycolicibacterium TaxID=1866885 RepID=A0A1X0JRD9_9MYCO|nr:hypothetical protein BST47_14290 [Mycolicibacterium tusciae]
MMKCRAFRTDLSSDQHVGNAAGQRATPLSSDRASFQIDIACAIGSCDGQLERMVIPATPALPKNREAAAATAPTGDVVAVDPSATMRDMAAARCAALIRDGRVEVRDGTAEATGCAHGTVDVAISVNNVMLWNRPAGFAELFRVLRPGGRLLLSVHRHVLDVDPVQLVDDAQSAGFTDVKLSVRARRFNSPAVELIARQPER